MCAWSNILYDVSPRSIPWVLLHGFAGAPSSWDRVLDGVAGQTILRPRIFGHGGPSEALRLPGRASTLEFEVESGAGQHRLESLGQARDRLSRKPLGFPGSSIERPQVGEIPRTNLSLAIGRSLQRPVMEDHDFTVGGELKVTLDHLRPLLERPAERDEGVLRTRGRGTPVSDSQKIGLRIHALCIGRRTTECEVPARMMVMAKAPAQWTRLRVPVPLEAVDAVAALCFELGASGVVTGQTDFRRRKTSTRTQRSTRIEAYFPPEFSRRSLDRLIRGGLEETQRHFPRLDPTRAIVDGFETQDYSGSWKAHFPPIPVGRRLLIAPSWHEIHSGKRRVLRIDPGQAFGTGHHPTTHGCLLEIERACSDASPTRGLDVGCGTGVLALAMRAFGIRRVSESVQNAIR